MGQMSRLGTRATTVATHGGYTRVTYHATVVVEFNQSLVRLNSGGWRTATTKARMNQAANQFGLRYTVYQRDFEWRVSFGGGDHEFRDGMVLSANGDVEYFN